MRHDAGLTAEQRDRAVGEFIELVAAVDGILQAQAKADAGYFATTCGRAVDDAEARAVEAAFLKAYRWQYIHSGAQHPQFGKVLSSLITDKQGQRIQAALATLQEQPELLPIQCKEICHACPNEDRRIQGSAANRCG
ncbi:MAG: hypothetical protein ACXWVI_03375 [Methyloceanibacter sp.]